MWKTIGSFLRCIGRKRSQRPTILNGRILLAEPPGPSMGREDVTKIVFGQDFDAFMGFRYFRVFTTTERYSFAEGVAGFGDIWKQLELWFPEAFPVPSFELFDTVEEQIYPRLSPGPWQ